MGFKEKDRGWFYLCFKKVTVATEGEMIWRRVRVEAGIPVRKLLQLSK